MYFNAVQLVQDGRHRRQVSEALLGAVCGIFRLASRSDRAAADRGCSEAKKRARFVAGGGERRRTGGRLRTSRGG